MGVFFLYSKYSLPNLFSSSGSSIVFNSKILTEIKRGLNIKIIEIEFNKVPTPNRRITDRLTMDFLVF